MCFQPLLSSVLEGSRALGTHTWPCSCSPLDSTLACHILSHCEALLKSCLWRPTPRPHILLAQIPEEVVPFCSQAHRMTEEFRSEGTSGGFQSNLQLTACSAVRSDQAVTPLPSVVLRISKDGACKTSEQPLVPPDCPHGRDVFPHIHFETPVFRLCPLSLVLL